MEDDTAIELIYLLGRVPARFHSATLADYQTPTAGLHEAKEAVRAWAGDFVRQESGPRTGLFLTGGVGVGKSMLAYAVAHYIAGAGLSVGALSVSRHFAQVRSKIGSNERVPTADEMVLDFTRRPWRLLLLDDLGVEKPTDWLVEQIYLLVDAAYLRNIPLLVTSNLDYAELGERLGERTVSRIVYLTDKIEVPGDDWRIKTAKERRA